MKPPEPSETLQELPSENEAEEPQTLESQIEGPVPRVLQSGTLGTVGSNPAFLVGNFVWGRVRNHPWWPGRVRDPELAVMTKRTVRRSPNSVFVSYFGDESYAWCQPMHLKPFKQEFAQMMAQSVSKSFLSAVRSALEEIGRCVEAEMACSCVDIEIPNGFLKQGSKEEFAISGYTPAEFLQLVKDVAKNCMVVDMLEITVLRSWVFAFNRKSGHQRCGVVDLIDKFDLDAEDDGTGDSWIDAPRKPEISEEKYKRRKKRSMAKLIAEMDLNAVEVSDDVDSVTEEEEKDDDVVEEDEKHEEEEKDNDVVEDEEKENEEDEKANAKVVDGAVVVGEGTGSGKRERKKSKYLSYPYAHLSGIHGKQSVFLLGDFEVKTSKKASYSSSTKLTGSVAEVDLSDKEEDQKGLVSKLESISTTEILSELFAAAGDSLHLKWNRTAKTVRGFFAAYRNALYSESLDFEAHQKKLAECGCLNRKITDDAKKSNQSKEGDSGRTSKKRKGRTNGETKVKSIAKRKMKKDGIDANGDMKDSSEIAKDMNDSSEKAKDMKDSSEKAKTPRKRLKNNETACVEASLDLGITKTNSSGKAQGKKAKQSEDSEGTLLNVGHPKSNLTAPSLNKLKKQMRIEGANVQTVANVPVEMVNNSSEAAKKSIAALINGKPSADAAQELLESPKVEKSGKKRRKNKGDMDSKALTDLNLNASNGLDVSQKKQKTTDENNSESPAALLLSFAPGVNLPSRDEIVSSFSKYGSLNEDDTEVMPDSGCARLVFMKSSDAENALHSQDKTGVFAPPNASYRVRYLPVNPSSPPTSSAAAAAATNLMPDRPLPYIRKNLETMISTLTSPLVSDKDPGSFDGLKPDAKENLVGEMQGLLEKVNKMLDEPPGGSSS